MGETDQGSEVVALAESAEAELVFLDMGFDSPSGTRILGELRTRMPETNVVVLSSLGTARSTMEALSLGALEYVCTEPGKLASTPLSPLIERAIHHAWVVSHKPTAERRVASSRAKAGGDLPNALCRPFDAVLIGISTGGPAALETILGDLRDCDLPPILIVQHMGRFFTEQLAQTLARKAGRPVREGREGMLFEPGTITLAPGGLHCEIGTIAPDETHHRLRIRDSAPVNGCRPSVDVICTRWKR